MLKELLIQMKKADSVLDLRNPHYIALDSHDFNAKVT